MLSVQAAEAIILNLVKSLDSNQIEIVALEEANGRILAQPVKGKLDIPHWDNSAMDGYALRDADAAVGARRPPGPPERRRPVRRRHGRHGVQFTPARAHRRPRGGAEGMVAPGQARRPHT